MLAAGTPLRALLEREIGYSLGTAQDLREMWTMRTFAEQTEALQEQLKRAGIDCRSSPLLGWLPCAISYDGQTRVHEVTAIIIRWFCEADWSIKVKVLDLLILKAQQNAEDMAMSMMLAVEAFVGRRSIVAVMRDGASVNEKVSGSPVSAPSLEGS